MRHPPQADQPAVLLGTVKAEAAEGPFVVFVYRRRGHTIEVVDASILSHPGPYAFTVPAGSYRLAAFADTDGDLRYDPARDRAALYHDGGSVMVTPGQTVDRLYLKVPAQGRQRIDFEFTLPASALRSVL